MAVSKAICKQDNSSKLTHQIKLDKKNHLITNYWANKEIVTTIFFSEFGDMILNFSASFTSEVKTILVRSVKYEEDLSVED